MRNLRVERPGSFLPVYSLILAALQLWLTWSLHARGRAWMVYDPAAILRFIPVLLAVALAAGLYWLFGIRGYRCGECKLCKLCKSKL